MANVIIINGCIKQPIGCELFHRLEDGGAWSTDPLSDRLDMDSFICGRCIVNKVHDLSLNGIKIVQLSICLEVVGRVAVNDPVHGVRGVDICWSRPSWWPTGVEQMNRSGFEQMVYDFVVIGDGSNVMSSDMPFVMKGL